MRRWKLQRRPQAGGARAGAGRPRGGRAYTAALVSRAAGCLFEVVETLVLTLIIFLVIQNFVAQPYKVEQHSMETTLLQGEYVLVDKLTPRLDDYSRGDIVVFDPPANWTTDGVPFIKRVIGLPGEVLEVHDGGVYVNGIRLDEPYVDGGVPTDANGDRSRWVIPEGELFVMGDNRDNSSDSRVFGPIPHPNVIGRAWLRYWPIDAFAILQTPTYPDLSPGSSRAPSHARAA